jgi:hypothetical protein
MTIEGVIYRALGIWMILTSAPDVAEAIVVKAFTGAGGPGAIGFSVGILEARMISPIVTLCGGMILFIIGNRSPRRMPGIPGDNALKRAANWIWNPPLDEEEEPPEEEQGASK